MKTDVVYPTKIDTWLAALHVLVPLAFLVIGFVDLSHQQANGIRPIFIGVVLGLVMVVISIPCRYTLKEKELFVECGVLKFTIPYSDITDIYPSSNPLSAPAMSLKRVMIVRRNGFCLVSPRQRDEFIQELKSRIKT
jgi:membrane protein YdbS with pleckstrin-like domain